MPNVMSLAFKMGVNPSFPVFSLYGARQVPWVKCLYDEWMVRWMNEWTVAWMSGWMNGWIKGWVGEWVDGGWMVGWMDGGWIDGWIEEWLGSRYLQSKDSRVDRSLKIHPVESPIHNDRSCPLCPIPWPLYKVSCILLLVPFPQVSRYTFFNPESTSTFCGITSNYRWTL